MAIGYLTNIDLNNNQVKDFKIDNVTSDPTGLAGEGQMIYRTDTNQMKYHTGSNNWVAFGTSGGTVTSVNLGSSTSTISVSGGPITTSGTITIGGTLGVANGGTGATTLTGILLGNGTSAISGITSAVDGHVLTADGVGGYAFEVASGDVSISGTPTQNQVAIWTDGSTIKGMSALEIDVNDKITLDQDASSYNIGGGNIANVTGISNTGFGLDNLSLVTTGNRNVAFGYYSLKNLTIGTDNVAIGYAALQDVTEAIKCVAIGSGALNNVTTGHFNVAVGHTAGSYVSTSTRNTLVGYGAGNQLDTTGTPSGGYNTFIGYQSGGSVTTGTKNVIIGSNDGSVYGQSSNYIIISDGGGNNRLQFSNTGAATFKATTPSPVVSTPIVSIADSVNGVLGGIGALASGGYPLQIWGGTLEFKTGSSSNIATATTKLTISTGGDATFSGDVIINTENSGIIVDLASRHGLMKYANYGAGLVGKDTGTDSNISTWLGRFSGTITSPTAVYQDLIISNSGNVGIGTTPTSKLTLLGTSTAASNTPSDAIVDIRGTSTAHLLMGVANVSPYGAWINTDSTAQPLVLMGTGGKVGIGTGSTAPQNNLTIQTATDVRVGIYGGVGYSGIQSISDNNNVWKQLRLDGSDIQFRIQDVPKLTISSGGTVKADAFAPLNSSTSILDFSTLNVIKFYTNSTPRLTISSTGAVSMASLPSGTGYDLQIDGGDLVFVVSTRKEKKNIEPIDIGLDFILSLEPVKYDLKKNDLSQVGFIAEDMPDERLQVIQPNDNNDLSKGYSPQSVNYKQITAPLVKAIQEQQTIIEDLKARIEKLEL